jgi:hypothetical protein
MTKHIVEYKMHTDGQNKIIPYFIEDGGYFPDDNRLVGVTFDDSDIYIPLDTVIELTSEEFTAKVIALEMTKQGTPLTSEEKETLANEWLDARGL